MDEIFFSIYTELAVGELIVIFHKGVYVVYVYKPINATLDLHITLPCSHRYHANC